MKNFNGLTQINIELTNKCNKNCWMCGRRKIEVENLKKFDKEISFELLKKISKQVPRNIIIAFHWNGEPLLYSKLEKAFQLFKGNIRVLDTNGKLLVDKWESLLNLETITISTFENDPEWKDQYRILRKFLFIKGNNKPNVIIRCLGNIEKERMDLYKDLHCIIATRILHHPLGSYKYEKNPTIPEVGFCFEMYNKLAINCEGFVSPCVRFDPNKEFIIGNVKNNKLIDIWNSEIRKNMLKLHINGNRNQISFCNKCDFWGIPTGL